MTALERVRNTIAGRPVDHLAAQPMVMMFADFDLDVLLTCSDPAREVADIAGFESIEWFPDQGPVINESRAALAEPSRLNQFQVPDPLGGGRMHDRIRSIEIMRRAVREDVSVVGWVEGPLALAQELRGLNRIMTDFVDDPAFVNDLLDFTAAVAMRYADAQIAAGADTIGMSDAAASMMGPVYYREFLFPRQLRVLADIKQHHPHVLTRLHMCGQTQPLIAQMRELPVDIYELDFPVDLEQARADLGSNRVISGNISTVTDLLSGSPADVERAAARCHRASGRFHIVNSGCEVSPLTPPDNLRALVRDAKENS